MRHAPRLALILLLGCATPARPAPRRAAVEPPRRPLTVVEDERAPPARHRPPLSGGTLMITRDGAMAVASDPDQDLVWLVSLGSRSTEPEVIGRFNLREGDEPGRLAEDAAGRVHVALRRGGAVVTLDPRRRRILARRRVCPAPRGLAAEGSLLHVACAGGELVSLPTREGAPVAVRHLPGDLRDVGVDAQGLWASRFRAAELVRFDGDEPVRHKVEPAEGPSPVFGSAGTFAAQVAWRTLPDPRRGGVWMLHQREFEGELQDNLAGTAQYYGGGVVKTAISYWADGAVRSSDMFEGAVLPVDAAPLGDGRLAVVFAGSRAVDLYDPEQPGRLTSLGVIVPLTAGQPVAVAHHRRVGVVIQYREQAALGIVRSPGSSTGEELLVQLGGPVAVDGGHRLFHEPTRNGIACASCHPEGGDDGHVWTFENVGARRTQPIGGGILDTAPYHWEGDLPDMQALLTSTYVNRMGGQELMPGDARAIAEFVDAIPDPVGAVAADRGSAQRGRALFEDPEVGCATCHAGPRGIDGRAHDVGTGGTFQTPPLAGIAQRAPYLHDGCADTLEERFGECHTPGHGRIADLDEGELRDLVAYVGTL